MPGAIINADVVIGRHCIINTGASVDHECVIGDYCHIAPHATLCGQVHIDEGTLMGVGSCAIPCVKIGSWCTIGAGATVINKVKLAPYFLLPISCIILIFEMRWGRLSENP